MLPKITLVSGPAQLRQWIVQPRLSARELTAQSTFCELSQLGYLLWVIPFIYPRIQPTKGVILVYTPGELSNPHPFPQLTNPRTTAKSSLVPSETTKGPPASPVQASRPALVNIYFLPSKLNNFELFGWLYTANVYRDLQGLCKEIGVRGFQIYGECMYTRNL